MVTMDLAIADRLRLDDFLLAQHGSLSRTAPFARVSAKIRLTESERSQVNVVDLGNGRQGVNLPPNPEFGRISVEIETADAAAVSSALGSWEHFTTADHTWVDPILEQLR